MSYLLDRRNKKKKSKFWVAGLVLLAVLVFFGAGIFGGLSYVASETFRPVLVAGNFLGAKFKNLGAYFISKSSLNAENKYLASKLADAEAKMAEHDSLRDENIILKELLGRTEESKALVLAAILSKPNQSAYDTMLVDAGSDEGLKVGQLALAHGYIPIGKVGDVTPNSAKIILFSSSSETTSAVLRHAVPGGSEENNIFYDLSGRGGGNFEMTLPRDVEFDVGDRAMLPGIDARVLALAETVISDPRDPFKKILLASPVNFQHLNFVQIEIK